MKYLLAIRDMFLTIIFITALFILLSFITQNKIPLSQQKNEIITLMPVEAFLRGSIKIDDDNSIINWRNNKNIVHWKFQCVNPGSYKVSLIHSKSSKKHLIFFSHKSKKLEKELAEFSKENDLGTLELSEGIHEVALYAPEVPKKTKLPDIYSIIISKTK